MAFCFFSIFTKGLLVNLFQQLVFNLVMGNIHVPAWREEQGGNLSTFLLNP